MWFRIQTYCRSVYFTLLPFLVLKNTIRYGKMWCSEYSNWNWIELHCETHLIHFSEKILSFLIKRDIEVLMKAVIFTPGLQATEMRNYMGGENEMWRQRVREIERGKKQKESETEMNIRRTRNEMRRACKINAERERNLWRTSRANPMPLWNKEIGDLICTAASGLKSENTLHKMDVILYTCRLL